MCAGREMERIKAELIELGMKFSAPVFFDDGENMFLPEKKPVRKFHLETLKKWKIPYVITYGHLLTNNAVDLDELLGPKGASNAVEELEALEEVEEIESIDEVEEVADSSIDVGRMEENPLYIQYNDIICCVSMMFDKVKSNDYKNLSVQLQSISDDLFALVEKNPAFVSSFLLAGEVKKHDFPTSAVNTAICTYLVSKKMNLPQKKIQVNITGALLHDVGMLNVPDSILFKNDSLNQEEYSRLKMHAIEGARLAGEAFHVPTEVINIVQQHHERWDGRGYPHGLKKESISSDAAIVAVCDAFEAMITEKSYRTSILGYQAMKNLISDNCRHFAPDVVRAFIQSMGVYPIGSLVLLNDSSIARVTAGNESAPLRPVVRILVSEGGSCYKNNSGPIVNLEDVKRLFIVRALDSKDLHGKIE